MPGLLCVYSIAQKRNLHFNPDTLLLWRHFYAHLRRIFIQWAQHFHLVHENTISDLALAPITIMHRDRLISPRVSYLMLFFLCGHTEFSFHYNIQSIQFNYVCWGICDSVMNMHITSLAQIWPRLASELRSTALPLCDGARWRDVTWAEIF